MLQDGKLHGVLVELIGGALLRIELVAQQRLGLCRRPIILVQPLADVFDLAPNGRLQSCQLGLRFADLGVFRIQLCDLRLQLRLLPAQDLQGWSRNGACDQLGVPGLRHAMLGFFYNAVGLCLGHLLIQELQPVGDDIVAFALAENVVVFLKLRQLLLRADRLALQLFHLLGKPSGDLHRSFVMRLEVALHVLLRHGVRHVRRQPRIGAAEADLNQLCIGNNAYRQRPLEVPQNALPLPRTHGLQIGLR